MGHGEADVRRAGEPDDGEPARTAQDGGQVGLLCRRWGADEGHGASSPVRGVELSRAELTSACGQTVGARVRALWRSLQPVFSLAVLFLTVAYPLMFTYGGVRGPGPQPNPD